MLNKKEYFKKLEENVEMKNEIIELNKEIVELNNLNKKSIDYFSQAMDLFEETEKNINKLEDENKILIDNEKELLEKIKDLEKDNEIFLSRNSALNEILGRECSDWHIEAGVAWRFSLDDSEIEKYKIPKNFTIGGIEDMDFDDNFIMCQFRYNDDDRAYNDYCIPCSLYTCLGGKLFKNNNEIFCHYDLLTIDNIKDLKIALMSIGETLRGKYIENLLKFIIEFKGKTFSDNMFYDFCQFNNRESKRKYLNKLISWGLIRRIENGLYKFILSNN